MTDKDKTTGRKPTTEERKLWSLFTRDISAFRKEFFSSPAQGSPRKGGTTNIMSSAYDHTNSVREEKIAPPRRSYLQQGADGQTRRKLERGKIPLEGRLDLHGMSQIEAYETLSGYLNKAQFQGKRCILVITGKGKTQTSNDHWLEAGRGVLKAQLPVWLKEEKLGPIVLDFCPARLKDGGSGAWYVLLRRKKD